MKWRHVRLDTELIMSVISTKICPWPPKSSYEERGYYLFKFIAFIAPSLICSLVLTDHFISKQFFLVGWVFLMIWNMMLSGKVLFYLAKTCLAWFLDGLDHLWPLALFLECMAANDLDCLGIRLMYVLQLIFGFS